MNVQTSRLLEQSVIGVVVRRLNETYPNSVWLGDIPETDEYPVNLVAYDRTSFDGEFGTETAENAQLTLRSFGFDAGDCERRIRKMFNDLATLQISPDQYDPDVTDGNANEMILQIVPDDLWVRAIQRRGPAGQRVYEAGIRLTATFVGGGLQ